jgi:hypothetical protein
MKEKQIIRQLMYCDATLSLTAMPAVTLDTVLMPGIWYAKSSLTVRR